MMLLIIDTSFFKDKVTSWMQPVKDGEGNIIAEPLLKFYSEVPDYYLKEIINEHKVKIKDNRGRISWQWRPVKSGAPTHALDLEVLCAAAAFHKGVHWWRPARPKRSVKIIPVETAKQVIRTRY
jgi:hypothetical protein